MINLRERSIRKPNRLKGYDYSKKGAYFVTICAKNMTELFSEITVGVTGGGRPMCVQIREMV